MYDLVLYCSTLHSKMWLLWPKILLEIQVWVQKRLHFFQIQLLAYLPPYQHQILSNCNLFPIKPYDLQYIKLNLTTSAFRIVEGLLGYEAWFLCCMQKIAFYALVHTIGMQQAITGYLSGFLLIVLLTGLYLDLLGNPPLSKDISLPGMRVQLATSFKWVIAFCNW